MRSSINATGFKITTDDIGTPTTSNSGLKSIKVHNDLVASSTSAGRTELKAVKTAVAKASGYVQIDTYSPSNPDYIYNEGICDYDPVTGQKVANSNKRLCAVVSGECFTMGAFLLFLCG